MLAAALRLDPDYETAWIWFASIAENDAERRYCYERAIQINPASVVGERLARIRTTESTPPPELADLEAPPLPEEFGGEHQVEEPRRRPWLPLALVGAALLAALIGGLWYVWPRDDMGGSPVYIAFAAGLTGSGADSAAQMQRGLQVFIDYANSSGGIDGHPIKIVSFDDEDDPAVAVEVANKIVEDGRFVAVVGHRLSSTTKAAGPIYNAAGLPMITPTATADDVTTNCEWCFRTVFDNSTQGKMIASYVLGILGIERAVIVSEESDYGNSLAAGFASVFESAGGTISAQYALPADVSTAGDTVRQTAEQIAKDHDGTVILLATGSGLAETALIELRQAGVDGTIFGSDSTSSSIFLEQTNADSEAAGVGIVTNGFYASAPVFVDSLNGDSVRLAAKIQDEYGEMPTWRSFTSADAGVAIVNGLRSTGANFNTLSVDELRSAVRDRWLQLDSPENSIPAFVGPLYFDANRTAPRPVAMGIASGNLFDSAPRQISLVSSAAQAPDGVPTIEVGENTFAVQRVVQTGVDFNLIRDLNTVAETFYADFFVWFKYVGDDDAADVVFTNISDPQTLVIDEVRSSDENGLKYKVFRVTGIFTSPLDFRSFPFDTQELKVHFQNRTLTSAQLVYAIDSDFLEIPVSDRLTVGGHATESINQINNWQAANLEVFAGSVGTSSNLGDPAVSQASHGIEFSQVGVNIDIRRNVGQFLLKNLLPLVLLLAITYISLFFSHDQTTERVSFGITGVLTGAVLLSTVVSVLPDVGYTVAIEWAFYAFILLSALCILVALIGGKLNEAKQISEVRTLDLAARIGYPVLVGLVVLGYWYLYR